MRRTLDYELDTRWGGISIAKAVFAFTALFLSAFQAVHAGETNNGIPPGLASNPLAVRPPAVGAINGIKLSIPNNYLLAGVQYKGEEPLMRTPRAFTPKLDTEIQHFAILLRLSNLHPVKTKEDLSDWDRSARTSNPNYKETWTTIGVNPSWYVLTGTLEREHDTWERFAIETNRGPFTRQNDLVYGLAHSTSPHPVDDGPLNTQFHGWGYDYFFDEVTLKTFINCRTSKMVVAPFDIHTECAHHFVVPELHAIAEAFYTKSDLHRWREIEERAKSIFHSFVVQ